MTPETEQCKLLREIRDLLKAAMTTEVRIADVPKAEKNNSWAEVLRTKIAELGVIADWASMTDYGRVRDHCRMSIGVLQKELNRLEGERHDDA